MRGEIRVGLVGNVGKKGGGKASQQRDIGRGARTVRFARLHCVSHVKGAFRVVGALDDDAAEGAAVEIAEYESAHVARAVADGQFRRALIAADIEHVIGFFARRLDFQREIFLRGDSAVAASPLQDVAVRIFFEEKVVVYEPGRIIAGRERE